MRLARDQPVCAHPHRARSDAVLPDIALALLLLVGTVIYLDAFPLVSHSPDEPHMLNEAKRLLAGEVMYRDVFDLCTPGWQYLMGGVFWLFGTTLQNARRAVAVIHGCTVVLVFFTCMRLGVRRPLAWAAGLAYLVVGQSAYPVASHHWLGTLLSMLLLLVCIEMRGRSGWIFAAGVLGGLLIAVHQQRGAVLAVGVALIVVADNWFDRRSHAPLQAPLIRNLLALVAGTLIVVVPLGMTVVARAGVHPVWHSLVIVPLTQYGAANRFPWGSWLFPVPPKVIFVDLLTYSPAAIVLTFAVAVLRSVRLRDIEPIRIAVVLTLFALFSIASIWYNRDLIHIALIIPVLLVVLAAGVEWLLCMLPAQLATVMGRAGAAAVVVAGGWQLYRNLPPPPGKLTVYYDSHFGRLPLSPRRARFLSQLDALLDSVPGRTLYRYPFSWDTYLVLDARNPTRFEYILPGFHTREQMEDVITSLRTADVPYIMVDSATLQPDDPIYRFIQERYQPLTNADQLNGVIWGRRRDAGAGG